MNFTLAAAGFAEVAEGDGAFILWTTLALLLLPAVAYMVIAGVFLAFHKPREPLWVWLSIMAPVVAWIGLLALLLT